MKASIIFLCIFLLIAACVAEDAAVCFDKLGSKLYSSRNYTEALDYLDRSLNQNASYVDAWVHKGNAQSAIKKYNASIEFYNQAPIINNKAAAA